MRKCIILLTVLFTILLIRCTIKKTGGTVDDGTVKSEEINIYEIESFLKNTIYIYNEKDKAVLTNHYYTPPQKYELDEVTIEIKDKVAIVSTDSVITHKIKSANFYTIENGEDVIKLAILNTDKGEIRIARLDQVLRGEIYAFAIKYDCIDVFTGLNGILFCSLPDESIPFRKK